MNQKYETEAPLFTVVIVACHVEPYIRQCLESIQKQTFEDFEALVVIETSDDNTSGVARACVKDDARFRIIEGPKTGSASQPRNIGMREAQGKYLIFVDGDDWLDEKALASNAHVIETEHPDVILNALMEHKASGETVIIQLGTPGRIYASGRDMFIEDVQLIAGKFRPTVCLWCFRRGIQMPEQTVGAWHQDDDWTYRVLLNAGKIVNTGSPIYNYRRRPGSVTTNRGSMKSLMDMTGHAGRLFDVLSKTADPIVFKILTRYLVTSFVHGRYFGYTANNFTLLPREQRRPACDCQKALKCLFHSDEVVRLYRRVLKNVTPGQALEGRLFLAARHRGCFRICRILHRILFAIRTRGLGSSKK